MDSFVIVCTIFYRHDIKIPPGLSSSLKIILSTFMEYERAKRVGRFNYYICEFIVYTI